MKVADIRHPSQLTLANQQAEPGVRFGNSGQGDGAGEILVVGEAVVIFSLRKIPIAERLQCDARHVRWQRPLARPRQRAVLQLLPRAERRQVLSGETEVHLDRPPRVAAELFEKPLLSGRRRLRPRERLIRREAQVRPVILDLAREREQRGVAIAVAQLLLEELAPQILDQLIPIFALLAAAQPGVAEG